MKRSILIVFVFQLIVSFLVNGQNSNIDSLLSEFEAAGHDTIKVEILSKLFSQTMYSDVDRALGFAKQSHDLSLSMGFEIGVAKSLNNIGYAKYLVGENSQALEYYLQSVEVSNNIKNHKIKAVAYANIGRIYSNQQNYPKAIEYFTKSLDAAKLAGDKQRVATLAVNIGIIYYNQSSYANALKYYIESQKICEEIGDKKGIANVLTNIGLINDLQRDYDQALENYNSSLLIMEELNDTRGVAACLTNIGQVYTIIEEYDKALDYFERCLELAEKADYKNLIATALNNMGMVYEKDTDFDNALHYYLRAIEIYNQVNDYSETAKALNGVGSIYKEKGNCIEALKFFERSLEIAQAYDYREDIKLNYDFMSRCYEELGNFEKAYKYAKLYSLINDSIYYEESMHKIADMQVKYDTEKKETEIQLLTSDKEVQALQLNRTRLISFSVSIGAALLLIITFILYNRNRLKKKANQILTAQKDEIEKQHDEIEKQRDQVTLQRDLITEQKQQITDSIHYAHRLQTAILPPEETMNEMLREYFILYLPKDIVSGDFYWMIQKSEKLVIAAADCTGHGVPGGFMSMLGVAYLNEIVNRMINLDTAQILNKLRLSVIKSLHQTGKLGESQDGMDISLCVIDKENMTLQFSGAHNPVYIVRDVETFNAHEPLAEEFIIHDSTVNDKYSFIELKADRMPIGIHRRAEKPFTSKSLAYYKGDSIYMFTDGYVDQFGGPNSEKFKFGQFRNHLLINQNKPMIGQRDALSKSFAEWIDYTDRDGDKFNQIDDVLVIGLKL